MDLCGAYEAGEMYSFRCIYFLVTGNICIWRFWLCALGHSIEVQRH